MFINLYYYNSSRTLFNRYIRKILLTIILTLGSIGLNMETFRVGDRVKCSMGELGVIISIDKNGTYPISVRFSNYNERVFTYTFDGRMSVGFEYTNKITKMNRINTKYNQLKNKEQSCL
jgi:hypothetical protein